MQEKLIPIMTVGLIIAAFAVGLLYGKVSVYETGNAPSNNQAAQAPAAPQEPQEVILDDATFAKLLDNPAASKGNKNAPVSLVEFTDYQCPFCARYVTDTYNQIVENYVDTGDVYYVVRDLPLGFHPNAKPAAMAARCAGDQNKYFEMHTAIFDGQQAWSSLSDPQETFESLAKEVGLSLGTFTSCYTSDKYSQAVDDDLALAGTVQASGTPTFYINGKQLVGAQPYSAFQAAIDEALNN